MARSRGWVVGDRDVRIMKRLGEVGPMTCEQIWVLEGRQGELKNLNRRLHELCEKRGAVPALLIKYSLERSSLAPLFALTHLGADRISLRDEAPMPHMSWTEMRHQQQTVEVYTGLIAAQRDAARPNFRWRADRGFQWTFEETIPGEFKRGVASVRPDVIVDSKTHAIRAMVEVETGSHPIRRRSGSTGKSIVGKARRYARFFYGSGAHWLHRSHYEEAFPDERKPVLVIVTTSPRRRDLVAEILVQDASMHSYSSYLESVVVTTKEAGYQLDRLMNGLEPLSVHAARVRMGVTDRRRELAPVSHPPSATSADKPQQIIPAAPGTEQRGTDAAVSLLSADAKQLRADFRTVTLYLNEYRAELTKLAAAVPPDHAAKLKELVGRDRSAPLLEAHARMTEILGRTRHGGGSA